jgi:hypothetical protein
MTATLAPRVDRRANRKDVGVLATRPKILESRVEVR